MRPFLLFACLLCLPALTGCGGGGSGSIAQAPDPLLAPQPGPMPARVQFAVPLNLARVACVGDSLTWGLGASTRAYAYPSLLATLLGPSSTVGNFGEDGATALKSDKRTYWNTRQFWRSAEFAPTTVVVMLGTNDTQPENWQSEAAFEHDLAALLAAYAALPGKPDVCVCLPPPAFNPPSDGWVSDVTLQNDVLPAIRQAAASADVPVIDLNTAFAGLPQDFIADQVHPNDLGNARLAVCIYESLTGHAPP